jgi:aryl-alcohol dehydrogenase-like predicted oxidoreductase
MAGALGQARQGADCDQGRQLARGGTERGEHRAGGRGSLRRLQVDTIDLYQSHQDDPATPIEETLGAYAKLIEQGKVRAIGASNFSAARLAESLAIAKKYNLPRYESLQPEYNLVSRAGYEAELEPLIRKESIGVISYYGLASGFLTGKYRSEADLAKSARGQGVKKYLDGRGLRILAALDVVAQRRSASPAQVAIAWLLAGGLTGRLSAQPASVNSKRFGAARLLSRKTSLR